MKNGDRVRLVKGPWMDMDENDNARWTEVGALGTITSVNTDGGGESVVGVEFDGAGWLFFDARDMDCIEVLP